MSDHRLASAARPEGGEPKRSGMRKAVATEVGIGLQVTHGGTPGRRRLEGTGSGGAELRSSSRSAIARGARCPCLESGCEVGWARPRVKLHPASMRAETSSKRLR